ncbi:KICSTOR complex protein C12orf66-like [Dendronephthya gigantea]|uniref:KICSTOR complex protein C12orf66-like n=1 Tax=Dendronephthya gigantea TaxID=151771 RepID=UPI00106924F5|nr:KICSTOR complex protein C12orf66-like [Dendronephthya gigantea]
MASRRMSPAPKPEVSSRPGSPAVHSVSSEQAFLETYFLLLSQFGFDKAKESAEKESNSKKGQLAGISPWFALISSLIVLAEAEKTYSSFSFVVKKRFRKDSLISHYQTLERESDKLCEVCSGKHGTVPLIPEVISHGLLAELCRHLNQFVKARQESMRLYENLGAVGVNVHANNSSGINYVEMAKSVEALKNKNSKLFHHPILDPIKSSFSVEMDILHHILQAQCDLADWKFLPSLLHLHESKAKLFSWNKVLSPSVVKDSFTGSLTVKKRFGGGSRRQIEVPLLFQWLARFHATLVSKFSLYFHATLSEQTTPSEMKSLTAKANVDYVSKIASFTRRADVSYVCLVLNTRDLKETYKGPGYHLPHVKIELPTGIHSYPAVFSYPNECPTNLWPSIVSLIQDRELFLAQEKIVYFYDERTQNTYFLAKVDIRMTLVAIFKAKKNERDSYVVNFFQDVTSDLRNTNVLNVLIKAT